MEKKDLLEKRIALKKKKPHFKRQEIHRRKKLKNNDVWRKPKGRHSKLRLQKAGHGSMPSTGWGSPREVKHLHKSGLRQVRVNSLMDLSKIKKDEEGIIINSAMGNRKKIEMIKKAEEMGIKILNIRDTKKFIEKISQEREEKKKLKKERLEKKSKKKPEKKKADKKETKKEEKPEQASEEEKKKEEKKEKDKILTRKS